MLICTYLVYNCKLIWSSGPDFKGLQELNLFVQLHGLIIWSVRETIFYTTYFLILQKETGNGFDKISVLFYLLDTC